VTWRAWRCVLSRVSVPVINEDVEAGYWRARAERAEVRAGRLEAETAALRPSGTS
jgi:hypothetical protein